MNPTAHNAGPGRPVRSWRTVQAWVCLAVAVLTAVTGCKVGPDYHAPTDNAPVQWSEPLAGGATNQPADLVQWWATFEDQVLNSLMERAASSNLEVRLAESRVEEARATRQLVRGDLGPSLGTSASYEKARRSKNALAFPVPLLDTETYTAGFDASWELDLFGGRRRALEAAAAEVDAAAFDQQDVLVRLMAEVAREYFEVRALQRRLAITETNIQVQQTALEITRGRFEAGLTSELDVTQASSLLSATRAQVPALSTSLKQGRHRLAVLLGQPPGALEDELTGPGSLPPAPPAVPVGLPSDLLRRRPDVRRAERELAASTARVGAATAELFPKFSLTGVVGLQSLNTSDWFTPGSKFWSVGPTVQWRLFESGRIRAAIAVQDARQEQAVSLYDQTVLRALEDAENALIAYAQEQIRQRSLREAMQASRRSVELASALYARGLTDFLDVAAAERSLFETEDQLVQSERLISQNLVALYKALGGGWDPHGPARPQ